MNGPSEMGNVVRLALVVTFAALALTGLASAATTRGAVRSAANVDIQAVTIAGRLTNLSQNPAMDTSPAVSPNGKEIAFVSSRDGRPDLYLMDSSGANVRRLTTGPLDVGGPTVSPSAVVDNGYTTIRWSPDGRRLAFDGENAAAPSGCFRDCYAPRVFVINANGRGLRLIADGAEFPSWSPAGRRLAYYSGYDNLNDDFAAITVTTLASGTDVNIRAHRWNGPVSAFSAPEWSPSGRLLAVQTDPLNGAPTRIELIAPAGGKPRMLAVGEEPSWSSNGQRLAFIEKGRLLTIEELGGAPTQLS